MPPKRKTAATNNQLQSSSNMVQTTRSRRKQQPVVTEVATAASQPKRRKVSQTVNPEVATPSIDAITESLFQKLKAEGYRLEKAHTTNSQTVPHMNSHLDATSERVPVTLLSESEPTPTSTAEPSTSGLQQEISVDASQIPSAPGSSMLIKHSLPLGYHVPDKLKHQIWGDTFVDISNLLPSSQNTSDTVLYNIGSTSLKLSEVKSKKLSSIGQWTNAFDIFMSLSIEKNQNSALSLIKYANNIRGIASEYGFEAARFYDEEFRRVRSHHDLDWTVIHDELWRRALSVGKTSNFRPQRVYQQSSNKGQSVRYYPKGYCWKFCRTGSCSEQQCKLRHTCYKCDQKHPPSSCNGKKMQNKPVANSRGGR